MFSATLADGANFTGARFCGVVNFATGLARGCADVSSLLSQKTIGLRLPV